MMLRGIVLVVGLVGAAAAAETPGAPTATVRAGDTLTAIARRHQTTISRLQALNDLPNPDRLRVGQRLRVAATPEPRASLAGFRAAYLGGPAAPQAAPAPARPRPAAAPIRMTRFGAVPAR